MVVLVTCKKVEDPFKNECASVVTTDLSMRIFPDAEGQLTPQSKVGSAWNSNSSKFLWLSLLQGTKFHSSACNYEWNLERTSNSSQSTHPVGRVYRTSALGRIIRGSRITYYSLMFFIAYAFNGHVHAFAGRVKVVRHLSCRTSAIFKYFCPLLLPARMKKIQSKMKALAWSQQ